MSKEKELLKAAKTIIDKERTDRIEKCSKTIDQLLKEHQCKIIIDLKLQGATIIPSARIVSNT